MVRLIAESKSTRERKVSKMETKHNAPYLIARYEQLQRCVNDETNLLVCAMYRDEMRQIKKIIKNT